MKTLWPTVLFAACLAGVAAGDTVESVSGAVVEGTVVSRDDKLIVMEVQVRGKTVTRKFLVSQVRAITVDGRREVLKAGAAAPKKKASGGGGGGESRVTRTRQEVEAVIREAGLTPPEWLEATALNHPATLDLDWPERPEGDWNNQKNVGQFVWDVINPNPGRWREGVKLYHHLMELHEDDAELRARAAADLGSMYHRLFQDYARAAHWWREAGDRKDPVGLAECYWKLGSKPMAVQTLNALRRIPVSAIKLYADMGETAKALKMADAYAKGRGAADAYVMAGDACRLAGRYEQAVRYYEKALDVPADGDLHKRAHDRARASIEAVTLFDALDVKAIPDGTYTASSLGYEGPITIEVSVRGGRIEDVKVTQHTEKQFYAALTDTPARIIQKQSVKGVDATSRATITSEAIINATAKALRSGTK